VRFPARITALAAFALAAACYGPTARADQTATISNESSYPVELYLKWSNRFYESPRIVLAPGEWRRVSGTDGARLFIRFNSTPLSLPPWENSYRVITRYTFFVDEPGYISRFRDVAPDRVDLFAH
jgi:hypothetical protein